MNDCYCIKNIQKSIETVQQTIIIFVKIIRYLRLIDSLPVSPIPIFICIIVVNRRSHRCALFFRLAG